MALLIASWLVVHQHAAAFALLLGATACLGAGFGLSVPALNTLAAALHPAAVDRSVLVLNALLGLGTAIAPVFVAVFTGLGFWIGLPVLASCLLAGLIGVSLRLPLDSGAGSLRRGTVPASSGVPAGPASSGGIPAGFWVFAAFAVLYGFVETMNGNWSQLDVTSLGVKPAIASLALTGFWAAVTVGRVLLAAVQRWLPSRAAYHGLPFLLAVAFVLIAALPAHAPAAAVAAFALAGLGCSALLPLTISFGQGKLACRRGDGRGRGDRLLPGRLRARGVRGGPADQRGRPAACGVRSQRGGGRGDGRAVAGGGARPAVARRGASPPGPNPSEPPGLSLLVWAAWSEPPVRPRATRWLRRRRAGWRSRWPRGG